MRWSWVIGWTLAMGVATLGCGGDGGVQDPPGTTDPTDLSLPLDYAQDDFWLCRPGLAEDQCLAADLDATAILPDGTTELVPGPEPTVDPGYDCFYVYPTVDLTGTTGNHTDFSDIDPMLDPLDSQAAWFRDQCRLFAPLYRQITIGTYLAGDSETYLERAYADVAQAFQYYLDHYNDGRDFVIMGHSQGSHMTRRLLQRVIEPDPDLRARMIAALLIGGDVVVPPDQTTGGSFDDVPLCTSDTETGCVIAYRSFAEGYPPPPGTNSTGSGDAPPGTVPACTNPAMLSGGKARFAGSYFPLMTNLSAFSPGNLVDMLPSVDTPFVLFRDFYAGECVEDTAGFPYLEVSVDPAPGDMRTNPIDFGAPLFSPGFLGLHVLDYNFPLDDLRRVVQAKAAHMP